MTTVCLWPDCEWYCKIKCTERDQRIKRLAGHVKRQIELLDLIVAMSDVVASKALEAGLDGWDSAMVERRALELKQKVVTYASPEQYG